MDHNQERRRGHFNRGRRGPDRGGDRRPPQAQAQERPGRDQVDVEQIMRDIRGRIAQRQGIDLSNQQIQDLAARRLESILDPRAIKPSLLDALRRTAGATGARTADKVPNEPTFTFEDTTIYDSHRGSLRFMRRLLNPLLKLFFNPNPVIRALHLQAGLNVEAAERDAERDRRQTEWNALHYEIVRRLVTEVSRVSIELQSLSMRVESLDARVDFNERRVRGIEGSVHRSRPQGRSAEPVVVSPVASPAASPPASSAVSPAASPAAGAAAAPVEAATETATATATVEGQPSDGTRRRRRRRRGRRVGVGGGIGVGVGTGIAPGESEPVAAPVASAPAASPAPAGVPSAPFDTHPEPEPAVEHIAQDTDAAPAPPERAVEAQQEPRESAPPESPHLSPPQAPDERAAPEPIAEPPGADRTEP